MAVPELLCLPRCPCFTHGSTTQPQSVEQRFYERTAAPGEKKPASSKLRSALIRSFRFGYPPMKRLGLAGTQLQKFEMRPVWGAKFGFGWFRRLPPPFPFELRGANNAKTNDTVERRCGWPTSKASGAITRVPFQERQIARDCTPKGKTRQIVASCGISLPPLPAAQ
jgi:hypothetical protein